MQILLYIYLYYIIYIYIYIISNNLKNIDWNKYFRNKKNIKCDY